VPVDFDCRPNDLAAEAVRFLVRWVHGEKTFTEGNSERFREQAKKTKAVVDLKNPSLPSFPSVDFPTRRFLQKATKETKIQFWTSK
jgi:hypothetical protein